MKIRVARGQAALVKVGLVLAIAVAATVVVAGATASKNASQPYVAGVSPFSNDPTLIPTSCGAQAVFKAAGYKWTWAAPQAPTSRVSSPTSTASPSRSRSASSCCRCLRQPSTENHRADEVRRAGRST